MKCPTLLCIPMWKSQQWRSCVYVNAFERRTNPVHHIPPPCHLDARVTLSKRFTVATSSDTADDRVQALPSFITKKNGWEQLGADRTKPSISGCNYAQSRRHVLLSYFPLWWDQDCSEMDRVMVTTQHELTASVQHISYIIEVEKWTSALITCPLISITGWISYFMYD